MAEQMEMDLGQMEEGLKTSGGGVDPVSGNEVPPGSLPEEVRDDVDASLSDGEYVVPADVVRFFGVKFFEDLREKAKSGLDEMDTSGRINGEPAEEDDFPFSLEELMSEDDGQPQMAEGGAVQVPKMTERQVSTPQFTAPTVTYGPAALMQPPATSQASTAPQGNISKTFVNQEGSTISVLFVNGSPMQAIPEGYVEDTPENRMALGIDSSQVPLDFLNSEGDSDNRATANFTTPSERTERTVAPEDNPMRSREALSDWAESEISGAMNIGSALGGAAGAILSGGMVGGLGGVRKGDQVYDQSIYNSAAIMAKNQGWDDLAESFSEKAGQYQTGVLGSVLGTGQKRAEKYINSWGSTSTGSSSSTAPTGTSTNLGSGPTPPGSSGDGPSTSYTGGSSTNTGSSAPTTSTRPPSRTSSTASPGASGVGSQTGPSQASADAGLSGQGMSNPGGFDEESGNYATGPMAKGGLVKRKTNTKNKSASKSRKGLGSK